MNSAGETAATVAYQARGAGNSFASYVRQHPLQVALTVLAWLVAPIDDHAVRMMVALAVGEVAGYAPAAYFAVGRMVPEAGIGFHGRNILFSLTSAGFAAVITAAVLQLTNSLVKSPNSILLMIAFVIAGLLCGVFAIVVGFSKDSRDRLLNEIMKTRVFQLGITGSGKQDGSGD